MKKIGKENYVHRGRRKIKKEKRKIKLMRQKIREK